MDAKVPVKMDHQGDCYRLITGWIQNHKPLLFQYADICHTCCSRDHHFDLPGGFF